MAAPQKPGLDYFPLDVDVENNKKIYYLESKYGPTAFAVLIKLWCRIYRQGYYLHWTEREEAVFARQANVELELLRSIIADCLEECIFSPAIYRDFGIITSYQIQYRYLFAVARRKKVEMIEQLTLINIGDFTNAVNVDINHSKCIHKPPLGGGKCQQKPPIVKNSIVKDSKELEEDGTEPEKSDSEPDDCSNQVFLRMPLQKKGEFYEVTEKDLAEWKENFPYLDIRQVLRNAHAHFNANPSRRKTKSGIRRCLVGVWLTRDQNSGKNLLKEGVNPAQIPKAQRVSPYPRGVTCNFCGSEYTMNSEKEECPNPECGERYYGRHGDGELKERFPQVPQADGQVNGLVSKLAQKLGG